MSNQVFAGRIGVIGSGALGCFYGARLVRAGHDVSFLMRRDYETVREHGLEVRSFEGDFHIRPSAFDSPAAMGQCDLVLVGIKTTDNESLSRLLPPVCSNSTRVMTLQNGLGNEEAVAAVLSPGNSQLARDRIL